MTTKYYNCRIDSRAWVFAPSTSEFLALAEACAKANKLAATDPVFEAVGAAALAHFDRIAILATGGFDD